jgi:transposase-like protein
MFTVVPDPAGGDRHAGGSAPSASLIDEIVREGARRMLAEALQAEVDAYIAQFLGERDERGRRLVVRNGSHEPREVLTSAGAVEVRAPPVNDKRIDLRTVAMAFKLIESAQARWRAVNAPHLVALVRAGATFTNGKLVERPDDQTQPEAA